MTALLDRVNAFLGRLPSTNARIAVTLVCVLVTALAYSIAWRAPDTGWESWLTFLAAMSGLDAAQFFAKRKTDAGHVEAQAKARATTTTPKVEP